VLQARPSPDTVRAKVPLYLQGVPGTESGQLTQALFLSYFSSALFASVSCFSKSATLFWLGFGRARSVTSINSNVATRVSNRLRSVSMAIKARAVPLLFKKSYCCLPWKCTTVSSVEKSESRAHFANGRLARLTTDLTDLNCSEW